MPATTTSQIPPADYDGDGSEQDAPISSYQSYAAEGDILAKQGEFRKAIEAYTKALNIRPTEKNCLVARSKCFLHLGDTDLALHDAESALAEDSTFFKGMYQKAEALYAKGDFEMALVFYHRGNKLRPELDEFRLGIQKAREAIDNSIGNPRDYKFRAPTNFSLDAANRQLSPQKNRTTTKKPTKVTEKLPTTSVSINQNRKTFSRSDPSSLPSSPERDVKQLLGELYADKVYLEQLLNDRDFINNPNQRIFELVCDGLKYLETRTEFWRQQKPIYARRKEASKIRLKMLQARQRQMEREKKRHQEKHLADKYNYHHHDPTHVHENDSKKKPLSFTSSSNSMKSKRQSQDKEYEHLKNLSNHGKYNEVLEMGKKYLASSRIPLETNLRVWKIHLEMGHAYLHLKNTELAELEYLKALEHSRSRGMEARVLGHLGRAQAKLNKFNQALESWCSLLNKESTNLVEKAWLCHDIARCHMEMRDHEKAKEKMHEACQFSQEANDLKWLLQSHVLGGQIYANEKNVPQSMEYYAKAIKYALDLKEEETAKTIEQAIQDLKLTSDSEKEAET